MAGKKGMKWKKKKSEEGASPPSPQMPTTTTTTSTQENSSIPSVVVASSKSMDTQTITTAQLVEKIHQKREEQKKDLTKESSDESDAIKPKKSVRGQKPPSAPKQKESNLQSSKKSQFVLVALLVLLALAFSSVGFLNKDSLIYLKMRLEQFLNRVKNSMSQVD